jgi:thioredoxin-like negative regulator of GroEL
MSRKRNVLGVFLLVTAACAPASVQDKVKALDEKVQNLEKQLQAVERSHGGGGGAGAAANPLDQEAQGAYNAVKQLAAAGKFEEAKTMLAGFGGKYASTNTARTNANLGRELEVVGKDCPSNWGIQKWFQGQDAIELNGAKPTVVVFWEVWCPHCRNEVPKMQVLYDKYKGKGLQLVGLTRQSRSTTEQAVQDIINQNQVKYPMAKEDGSVANHFAVSGIPAAAVVKKGKIVWRGHPAYITDQMIESWLAS